MHPTKPPPSPSTRARRAFAVRMSRRHGALSEEARGQEHASFRGPVGGGRKGELIEVMRADVGKHEGEVAEALVLGGRRFEAVKGCGRQEDEKNYLGSHQVQKNRSHQADPCDPRKASAPARTLKDFNFWVAILSLQTLHSWIPCPLTSSQVHPS